MRRSTEASRARARAQTRRRLRQALDEMFRAMSYGASISPAEREWLFFSALRRIENAETMAKQDRISEPNGPAKD